MNVVYQTATDLAAGLAKWQAILHLLDWEIEARLVPQETFGDDRAQVGDCGVRANRVGAEIRLATAATIDPTVSAACLDMERTLVHELLHCVFRAGDLWEDASSIPKPQYKAYERGVEQMARSLVDLDRRAA